MTYPIEASNAQNSFQLLIMSDTSSAGFVKDRGIPEVLFSLWVSNGLPENFLSHLKLTGNPDTVVQSSFRVGLAAQVRDCF